MTCCSSGGSAKSVAPLGTGPNEVSALVQRLKGGRGGRRGYATRLKYTPTHEGFVHGGLLQGKGSGKGGKQGKGASASPSITLPVKFGKLPLHVAAKTIGNLPQKGKEEKEREMTRNTRYADGQVKRIRTGVADWPKEMLDAKDQERRSEREIEERARQRAEEGFGLLNVMEKLTEGIDVEDFLGAFTNDDDDEDDKDQDKKTNQWGDKTMQTLAENFKKEGVSQAMRDAFGLEEDSTSEIDGDDDDENDTTASSDSESDYVNGELNKYVSFLLPFVRTSM